MQEMLSFMWSLPTLIVPDNDEVAESTQESGIPYTGTEVKYGVTVLAAKPSGK